MDVCIDTPRHYIATSIFDVLIVCLVFFFFFFGFAEHVLGIYDLSTCQLIICE